MQIEYIKKLLLPWLTDSKKIKLLCDMRENFPNLDYYRDNETRDIFQGDGWNGLELVTFDTMEKRVVSGLILSNTCDVSPENPRLMPPNLVFASVIQCSVYEGILFERCSDKGKVLNHMKDLRNQALTNRFYLPKTELRNDFVVLLDDIHTIPLKYYLDKADRALKVRLSNAGFYIFIIKLSAHFCRLTDNVDRDAVMQ